MTTGLHVQRMNVLTRAHAHGWTHNQTLYDNGNIICDEFTSPLGVVRVVWLRTPWSDAGRWTGSIFSEKATGKERNVCTVHGKSGLLELLSSITVTSAA